MVERHTEKTKRNWREKAVSVRARVRAELSAHSSRLPRRCSRRHEPSATISLLVATGGRQILVLFVPGAEKPLGASLGRRSAAAYPGPTAGRLRLVGYYEGCTSSIIV
jgi:hypothetical protein